MALQPAPVVPEAWAAAHLPGTVAEAKVTCYSVPLPRGEDGGDAGDDAFHEVLSALEGVECNWGAVTEALGRHELPDGLLARVVKASAEKLSFWVPDSLETEALVRVVRRHMAEESLDKVKAFASPRADPQDATPKSVEGGGSFERMVSVHSKTSATSQHSRRDDPGAEAPEGNGSCEPLASTTGSGRGKRGSFTRNTSKRGGSKRADTKLSRATTASTHLYHSASLNFHRKAGTQPAAKGVFDKARAALEKERILPPNPAASRLKQFKVALFFFITVQMLLFGLYVVFYMTPMTWDVIGFPILVARSSAYGACFWTGVLFLTMSRDLISRVAHLSCVQRSQLAMQFLNCYKEIHVFSAYEVLLDGFLHALMHHVGTFVALERNDTAKLNEMLVCAQAKRDLPDGYVGKAVGNFLKAFQFPSCPLPADAEVGYLDGVLSTPGITGYLLLVVICLLGWFSRKKQRKANFRVFYALHHLLVPAWVVLLVLHGANDWVGVGFPLVILVAGIPILLYAWTRLRRTYTSLRPGTRVTSAKKSVGGKLLRLEVELSSAHRPCRVGEFAYINVPCVGYTEWHPYTICNSEIQEDGRQVITFCIMSVGKWTRGLHGAFADEGARPAVHIDGPYYAPTVSMPRRSTVVGIGAGVGVTPFLSFLGSMAGDAASAPGGGQHKSAHVIWMSAFATDFMLFQDLFSRIEDAAARRGKSCTFHLHATPRFGAWNGRGVGCVFELAARKVWDEWLDRVAQKEQGRVPSFSLYPQPLHAVVSTSVLDSGNPMAVVVGSPDFYAELLTIGDADLSEDVFVYFCGNPLLQKMVQAACTACNKVRETHGQRQRYFFYFERFG